MKGEKATQQCTGQTPCPRDDSLSGLGNDVHQHLDEVVDTRGRVEVAVRLERVVKENMSWGHYHRRVIVSAFFQNEVFSFVFGTKFKGTDLGIKVHARRARVCVHVCLAGWLAGFPSVCACLGGWLAVRPCACVCG